MLKEELNTNEIPRCLTPLAYECDILRTTHPNRLLTPALSSEEEREPGRPVGPCGHGRVPAGRPSPIFVEHRFWRRQPQRKNRLRRHGPNYERFLEPLSALRSQLRS